MKYINNSLRVKRSGGVTATISDYVNKVYTFTN